MNGNHSNEAPEVQTLSTSKAKLSSALEKNHTLISFMQYASSALVRFCIEGSWPSKAKYFKLRETFDQIVQSALNI